MEDTKDKMSLNAKVILSCTIALVIFLSGAMFVMYNYADELSKSPLTIGAKKIAIANNAPDVSCTCIVAGVASETRDPTFYFNTTNIWDNGKRYLPGKPVEINFSAIKFNSS